MQRNPKAYIRIRGKAFDFKCYLGNGRARVTGGGAEYEAQRRPAADAVTLFTGNALLTMDVPVLFDGWGPPGNRQDIEADVEQIYNLCVGVGRKPPPNFTVTGPIPFSGRRFQMSLPEEMDEPRPILSYNDPFLPDGTLVRQALMLKLIEFNDPTTIKFRKTRIASAKREADLASIVLPSSMNLLEVAARYLNSADDAPFLGRINDIKDLRKKQPKGTRIKLGTAANLNEAIEAR